MGPSWAQPENSFQTQCDSLKTCFLTVTMKVRARPCWPERACLGPNIGARHTDPSWPRAEPKLDPTGLSSAQVAPARPNLRPGTGPPVGFWLGQAGLILSSLSCSLGEGGSRCEATRRLWRSTTKSEILATKTAHLLLEPNVVTKVLTKICPMFPMPGADKDETLKNGYHRT